MGSVSSVNPGLTDLFQTMANTSSPLLSSPSVVSALEAAPTADIVQTEHGSRSVTRRRHDVWPDHQFTRQLHHRYEQHPCEPGGSGQFRCGNECGAGVGHL